MLSVEIKKGKIYEWHKNSNLFNTSKLPVVHFVLIRTAVPMKENFQEKFSHVIRRRPKSDICQR